MIATLPAAIAMILKRDYNQKRIITIDEALIGGFNKKITKSISGQSVEQREATFKSWTIKEDFKIARESAIEIHNYIIKSKLFS